jgi:hypothetical protein
MAHRAKGQAGPATARHNRHQAALDRDLLALERRKLVELASGRVKLTRAGYQAIVELELEPQFAGVRAMRRALERSRGGS